MPSAVRQVNEARARNSLLKNQVMSRADLARELGMTRATASSIVCSLIENGEVLEVPEVVDMALTRTGRPAVQLKLNADHAFFLGAYVSATRVYLCAVDFTGTKRHISEQKVQSGKTAPEEVAQVLAKMVNEYLNQGVDTNQIAGLAVSVPGVVEMGGNVLRAPPLGWNNVPLKEIFSQAIQCLNITLVLNDANAFAVVAENALSDDDRTDALFVLLEDGVGGCIVSDGRMLNGRDGIAGEFGHIPVGRGGFDNLTGIEGALENFVSRCAIIARYNSLGGKAKDFREFIDNLLNGDSKAAEVQSECIHYFSRGLSIASSLLNPRAFVIGGRASVVFHHTEKVLEVNLANQLIQGTAVPKILMSSVGPEGPAIGAALTLQKGAFALPADAAPELLV